MNNFKKSRRLRSKKDYDNVFANAQKIATKNFLILYRNNSVNHARLGLIIAKKVANKAHDRNRLKRIVRENFRTKSYLPAVDIIFLARAGLADIESGVLRNNLERALSKI